MMNSQRQDVLAQLNEAYYPYFIQNEKKTLMQPINCIDCLRIHLKLKELKQSPTADPTIFCGH